LSVTGEDHAACADAEPFALLVTDDSMAPTLPRGSVVVVDPAGPASDGVYVVLAHPDGPLLRRLRVDGSGWRAVREDDTGEGVPVLRDQVLGVVVQRAGRRRREHRRFD